MREPSIVNARGVERRLSALIAAADVLATDLPPARTGSLVTFAFENDHAAFVVALWATWLRGHTVALPRDARRLAVGLTMQLPDSVAFLHDTGAGQPIRVSERAWPAAGAQSVRDDMPLGSLLHCVPSADGKLERLPIAASGLRQQMHAAATAMPLPDGARLVVTYAAGHLPALAPGLLLPLQHGAVVVSACGRPVEALAELLAGTAASDLLASPDLLRGLARRPRGALGRVQRAHTLAALDRASSERLQREHGVTVHELLPRLAAAAPLQAAVEALLAMPGVDDAAVVQRTVQGVDCRFAMVAVGAADRAAVTASVQAALGIPAARLALMDRLPRDRNGDLDDSQVLFACGVRADGSPPDRELHFTDERWVGNEWLATVLVPADFAGFDGHFVGYPVLSGSVQLHDLVLPALARALAATVVVTEFTDLKFLARISPGDTVQIRVEPAADRSGAAFAIARGAVRCTGGRANWRSSEAGR